MLAGIPGETALTRFTQVDYAREMASIALISGNGTEPGNNLR